MGLSVYCAARKGMVEVNKLVRSDSGLQQAFGRARCAEQSVIQETLDASDEAASARCTSNGSRSTGRTVRAMAMTMRKQLQILDVDMSGHPCGPKATFATKGYFAGKRNRRGRQLGRVLATHYNEVVCDRTFEGTVQLTKALQPLISATEQTLGDRPVGREKSTDFSARRQRRR